jgi:hypothetical protein
MNDLLQINWPCLLGIIIHWNSLRVMPLLSLQIYWYMWIYYVKSHDQPTNWSSKLGVRQRHKRYRNLQTLSLLNSVKTLWSAIGIWQIYIASLQDKPGAIRSVNALNFYRVTTALKYHKTRCKCILRYYSFLWQLRTVHEIEFTANVFH